MPNVALIDLKDVDGEPWEVAAVAGEQAADAVGLAAEAAHGLVWAASNSWMSQEYHRTGRMPDAADFGQSGIGRNLLAALDRLADLQHDVEIVTKAAAFDPRSH